MAEPKPLASLTSSLLARKGAARPAMRRQAMGSLSHGSAVTHDDLGWNDMGYDVDPTADSTPSASIDLKPMMPGTLAAVDHSHDADAEPAFAAKPAVVQQREELAERVAAPVVPEPVQDFSPEPAIEDEAPVLAVRPIAVAAPAPAAVRRPRAATTTRRTKAAFTLRLDTDRHLRLRLASAISNRSAQTILIELLDDYLASLPELDLMANRATSAH